MESLAYEYAKTKESTFQNIISQYNIKNKIYTKEECDSIYINFKSLCKFDNLIQVSYLFEDNNRIYKYINSKINMSINRDDFKDIYINYLGNIYNKVFKKQIYIKISYIEKIDDVNIQIKNLEDCINGRIQHYKNCKIHMNEKYNDYNHRIEILQSIYMFNKIKAIQKLLNKYKEKYILFKEQLYEDETKIINEANKKAAEAKERIKNFENLSIESSSIIEEPFIEKIILVESDKSV